MNLIDVCAPSQHHSKHLLAGHTIHVHCCAHVMPAAHGVFYRNTCCLEDQTSQMSTQHDRLLMWTLFETASKSMRPLLLVTLLSSDAAHNSQFKRLRIGKTSWLQPCQLTIVTRNTVTRNKVPLDPSFADADSADAATRRAVPCHCMTDCLFDKRFAFLL